ncbi:ribbon-helix-helix domain-containing protein [Microbacterium pseudoresistens]|uniref:Metal-responsive CopG/Arc/MetJ family transcriptional regulator n=1 Tax=Microbacterium pseudoresistens TaxID=640634 RepID=A0A7Y9ET77_9MICO|nr:CopG family transcriptional regulator [Microbacterium pseudoresistens]NYD53519.1 metal-responsive CopG/Arc/MetJ family transcriptional regulator [Microbacterium pseudoresistens]
MRRTNIYLEDRQTKELDRLAKDAGVPRAEIIRRLLDRALIGEDIGPAALLGAIDASFGALAIEVPERGATERDRHLDDVWAVG